MQKKLATCQRIKGRTCRESHRISKGIHEIMPARAASRNEGLLQRKNQQVTLTVRQDSTHRSICSRFRQWGNDSRGIGRNGSVDNRSARSEFNRNPTGKLNRGPTVSLASRGPVAHATLS